MWIHLVKFVVFRVIKWQTEETTEKITITPDTDKTQIIKKDLLDLDMVQITGIRPGDMAEAQEAEITTGIGLMKGVDGRAMELNIILTVSQLNKILEQPGNHGAITENHLKCAIIMR